MSENEIIIYTAKDGGVEVSLMASAGKIWLAQIDIAKLFGTSVPNISMHIRNVLKDKELSEVSVVKNYLTTE